MITTFGIKVGLSSRQVAAIFIFITLFVSCADDTVRDNQLKEIAEIVSDSAETALNRLNNIDSSNLSVADRHYRDLLVIKARDKAFITHTNDSLIMSVIDYVNRHKNIDWYPEALYYGGRVYSDLGDAPTALRYFHSALDALPENGCNLELNSAILSQTALLMNSLRLYDEAIPLLNQSISIDTALKDTVNTVYDLLLLGDTELNKKDFEQASSLFEKALFLSERVTPSMRAKVRMYLAMANHKQGNDFRAIELLQESQDSISEFSRTTFLATASQIYKSAGMNDSAYVCALRLLRDKSDDSNLLNAYQILLSPQIQDKLDIDSIRYYIIEYSEEMEKYLDNADRQLLYFQQTKYNYDIHEREKINAIMARNKLSVWLLLSLVVISGLSTIVFYLKFRNNLHIVKLHQSLANVARLEVELMKIDGTETVEIVKDSTLPIVVDDNIIDPNLLQSTDKDRLRLELQNKLNELASNVKSRIDVDSLILKSKMYKDLQEKIKNREGLSDKDAFWNKIEETILKSSPDFKRRLELLSGGKLRTSDYRMAMLVKCGITPTETSVLVHKSKSTISNRRKKLMEICIGKEINYKLVDEIIRCL